MWHNTAIVHHETMLQRRGLSMTDQNLSGKTAIVTGSSRGIGAAIAQTLASRGASVVVNFASKPAPADELVAVIKKSGAKAIAFKADVSNDEDVVSMFDEAIKTFGGVDILVNNAGILQLKAIADMREEEFDAMFNINVKGVFLCCRQAARKMRNNGRIINLSSSTTRAMMPTYGPYAATKGAVEQLTRSLSKELGGKGISVNAVSPGPTDTDLFRDGKTEQQIKMYEQMSAFGRLGQPQDIAEVIAFLASEESRWITGQNIVANGGMI